eukprot:1601391-Amphidinium_carterae.1
MKRILHLLCRTAQKDPLPKSSVGVLSGQMTVGDIANLVQEDGVIGSIDNLLAYESASGTQKDGKIPSSPRAGPCLRW